MSGGFLFQISPQKIVLKKHLFAKFIRFKYLKVMMCTNLIKSLTLKEFTHYKY